MNDTETGGAAPAPLWDAPVGADPAHIAKTFAEALQNHRQHRMAEAEDLYRQVLALDPNHVDALHMLGVLAYQAGKPEPAVDLIGRAIALNGTRSEERRVGEEGRT